MVGAGGLAELLVVESVARSLASSVVESVASSVSLVIVPLGDEVCARSGILSLVTDGVSSSRSI